MGSYADIGSYLRRLKLMQDQENPGVPQSAIAYRNVVASEPKLQDYNPSKGRRIFAGLTGALVGASQGGGQGREAAESILYDPFNREMSSYQQRLKNTGELAKFDEKLVTDRQNQDYNKARTSAELARAEAEKARQTRLGTKVFKPGEYSTPEERDAAVTSERGFQKELKAIAPPKEQDNYIETSPGASLFNRKTGAFDATAPGPVKPPGSDPVSYQEYQLRKSEGYKGTYGDYQKEKANLRPPSASGMAATDPSTGMNQRQVNTLQGIIRQYNSHPLTAAANKLASLKDSSARIKKDPSNAANQLSVLYTTVTALDPRSTVRESEVELAQKISSLKDKLATWVTRIGSGQLIPPATAIALATEADALTAATDAAARKAEASFRSNADAVGVGEGWKKYRGGFEASYDEPKVPQGGAPSNDVIHDLVIGPDGKLRRK